MTTTVLVEERYLRQTQPSGLVEALRRRGDAVTVVHDGAPEEDWDGALCRASVVVARGRSPRLIAALQRAQNAGIPTVDTAQAVAAVRDKRVMSERLDAAGVPVPRTWIGTGPDVVRQIAARPARTRRLIAKPVFGDNGNGISVHTGTGRLRATSQTLVVQELIPSDGADLKLYVIGRQVWAVRKPSPVTTCTTDRLGPVLVTPRLRELALACGAAFDLTLYGVDCIEAADHLVVIEVNDFPNYTHVPDAADLLAGHLDAVRAA